MRSLILLCALLLPGAASAQSIDRATAKRIDRILKATPLIDGHNDLAWELREKYGFGVGNLASGTDRLPKPLMTDIERLRAGRVGGQFWSVWITTGVTGDAAIRLTLEQIDVVRRMIAAYPADLELARTAGEIVKIHRAGRIASLIGIEGGDQIGESLAALRQFHALGARYMTLTHNKTTSWADSATDEAKHGGLSPFGLTVVREMNRLGMLVDLSHVSPDTARDAITASAAPVIFSHSNALALNDHPRNVPDDVLRLLPAKGGVVMVNFYPVFLSPVLNRRRVTRAVEEARLKALHPQSAARVAEGLAAWDASNPAPGVAVAVVADHIEHIAHVAGHDHVGIGGDLDGVPSTATGLEGADGYPLLFAELIKRGWSDANLARLAGGNLLSAMRGAEAVAVSMRAVAPALDRLP